MKTPEIFTAKEAAAVLMIMPATLRRMIRAGKIPCYKRLGNICVITRDDLITYIKRELTVPMKIRDYPTLKELKLIEAAKRLCVDL